jgi:hypothetical protein
MGKIKDTIDKVRGFGNEFDTLDWFSMAAAIPVGDKMRPENVVKRAAGALTDQDKLKRPKAPPDVPELLVPPAPGPPARRKRPGRRSTILTSRPGELTTNKPTLLGQ